MTSLQIGQTNLELAVAAAWAEPCSSRATRDVISSFSVDIGVLDVWLLNDTELSEGESIAGLRMGALLGAGAGGARPLPVPNTLPPPRLLREAIALYLGQV